MTGKTTKESPLISAFWKAHKVVDLKLLSGTELDEVIEKWLIEYQERRIKEDKGWWYPSIPTSTLNDVRNKRTGLDKVPRIHYN